MKKAWILTATILALAAGCSRSGINRMGASGSSQSGSTENTYSSTAPADTNNSAISTNHTT